MTKNEHTQTNYCISTESTVWDSAFYTIHPENTLGLFHSCQGPHMMTHVINIKQY